MKKLRSLFLSVLALFVLAPSVFASSAPRLWINGDYVTPDVPPTIQNDRTLVPLRVISESLGFQVEWNESDRLVTIKGLQELGFRIGDTTYTVDGENRTLDVAPMIISDRTFLPIRAVAESLNVPITWDAQNRTVVVGDGYIAPSPKSLEGFREARVVSVVDGDTIKVNLNGKTEKVRLVLVDTPETKHPKKGVEYYGKEASAFTTSQLSGKTVYLQKDVSERDRYGRLLAYVWTALPSSSNPSNDEIAQLCFNSLLLEKGYARLATFPPDVKYVDFFRTREKIARENGYGLWGNGGADPSASVAPPVTSVPLLEKPSGPVGQGTIRGNRNSKIYHLPHQRDYDKISPSNIVYFQTEDEAIQAGYRPAKR